MGGRLSNNGNNYGLLICVADRFSGCPEPEIAVNRSKRRKTVEIHASLVWYRFCVQLRRRSELFGTKMNCGDLPVERFQRFHIPTKPNE